MNIDMQNNSLRGAISASGIEGLGVDKHESTDMPSGWWTETGQASTGANMAMLNDAIVPAALAAMAYSNRSWVLDVAAGLVDPMAWADDQSLGEDSKGLARAMLVSKTCRALSSEELGIDPSRSGSSLIGGVWRNGDLASALACVRTKENGERELHLSIRGTDWDKNPDPLVPAAAVALAGFQYIVGTFLSIDKHAKRFSPLAESMERYAADPVNRISKIVVSGHSLGAAAAEKLGLKMKVKDVPVVVFGFGSPGRGEGLREPILALAYQLCLLTQGVAARSVEVVSDLLAWAGRLSTKQVSKIPRFSEMVSLSAQKLSRKSNDILETIFLTAMGNLVSAGPRTNIVQFRHPNDPIPKLGSFLYSTQGGLIASDQQKTFLRSVDDEGETGTVVGFRAHQSHRYADAVLEMAKGALSEQSDPSGVELMSRSSPECDSLRDMDRALIAAGKLDLSFPNNKLSEMIVSARKASVKALLARDAEDPTIARMLNLPLPQVSEKLSISRALRSAAALRAATRLGEEHPFKVVRKEGGGFGGYAK